MKQLFMVEIHATIVVLADDAGGACELAQDVQHEVEEWRHVASQLPRIPVEAGWDESSIPFLDPDVDDDTVTIGEWIRRGAAPLISSSEAPKPMGLGGPEVSCVELEEEP